MARRFRLLAIILATTAGPALGQQAEPPAYLNPALPIDQRVDDLAARMASGYGQRRWWGLEPTTQVTASAGSAEQ
jgi:hypothetical protein